MTEFLKDNCGKMSATRLALLSWSFGILAMWLLTSWQNKKMQPIDNSIVALLGVFGTAKVSEKFAENKNPTPPNAPSVDPGKS